MLLPCSECLIVSGESVIKVVSHSSRFVDCIANTARPSSNDRDIARRLLAQLFQQDAGNIDGVRRKPGSKQASSTSPGGWPRRAGEGKCNRRQRSLLHSPSSSPINMRSILRRLGRSTACNCTALLPRRTSTALSTRCTFHTTSPRRTDGVFRELTAQRLQTPWIDALRKQQAEGKNAAQPSETPQVPKERNLEPKHMDDSFHKVVLPLARDPWLLDTYLNASGHIRLGTIFMDLDALSGVIAYKHTGEDVTTVTASCDRIVINHPLTEICDLELSGKVTYSTGRSSMEITMQVAKAPGEGQTIKNEDILIHCTMTMVALDPGTRKYVVRNSMQCDHRI